MIARFGNLFIVALCLGTATLGGGGCAEPWWPTEPAGTPPDAPRDALAPPGQHFNEGVDGSAPQLDTDKDAAVIVLRMHFDVLRVDLPLETIRHSLKLWNHVDESVGDPGLTALLARNGFRVGVTDAGSWAAIRTILAENEARTTRVEHVALEDLPLVIPLGEVDEGESYFLHRRGGKLAGGAFHAGKKQIRVDYATDEKDPRRVTLRATPVVVEERMRTKLVAQGDRIVTVRDHEGQVFRELAATVTVGPGELLVIGSSAPADDGFLLGSWWLTSSLDLEKYETVLFISAQPTRVE